MRAAGRSLCWARRLAVGCKPLWEVCGMAELAWPPEGLTRVPYALYGDADLYVRERRQLFMGATWNFLCLEIEIPNPGDYRATFVGEVPVIVARDYDGSLGGFENRCAHRGALLCFNG